MKYITIKDIARHLSISVSTVSRALGDDKNIRKETKEKVIEAAKRLGYRPNPVAINLKYGHTNTVGVIVPEANGYAVCFTSNKRNTRSASHQKYKGDYCRVRRRPGKRKREPATDGRIHGGWHHHLSLQL